MGDISMIKKLSGICNLALEKLLRSIIRGYQSFISPMLPARCRYYPTCSQYGLQAITWHGATKGGWLLVKRLSRCHPLGGHGIDFVPLPLYRYQYHYFSDNFSSSNTSKHQSSIDFSRSNPFTSSINNVLRTDNASKSVSSCCTEQDFIRKTQYPHGFTRFVYVDKFSYTYHLNLHMRCC